MTIDLRNKTFLQNPYPLYAELRAKEPVAPVNASFFLSGKAPAFLLTRYDDVSAALKDPRFSVDYRHIRDGRDLSKTWWMPGIIRAFLKSMVMVDEPDHTRLRTLVHKAFTPRMIRQLSGRIEEISHELLDKALEKPTVDLIADFALPLPLTIISEMMGVPPQDRPRFQRMIQIFLEPTYIAKVPLIVQQLVNGLAMHRMFKKLVVRARKSPQDNLTSALVQAEEEGDRLSENELIAMLLLLLLAGHETTVNLIGSGTLALLEHPEQLEKLQANPELLDNAIEEMLRFTNPVQQIAQRYTVEDVEVNGQLIPKGTVILIAIASANRDESVFDNPHQFDITRDPNPHIAFGLGIHYCLGAPLAQLEAEIAFTGLLARCPNIRLAVPVQELEWRGGPSLRGLKRLPVYL
jgi:cytochrome P450 PksS